jgi:hypothetical protein
MRASFIHAKTIVSVITLLAVCSPARAEQFEGKLPTVPGLIAGKVATQPPSFVVDGTFHFSPDHGIAFRVVRVGTRELSVVSDDADGTPIALSDGHQMLLYDVVGARIVHAPVGQCYVRVDWDRKNSEKPLTFAFEFPMSSNPDKLNVLTSWFRLDRFVEAVGGDLRKLDSPAGTELFCLERPKSIQTIETRAEDPNWFRFRSLDKDGQFYSLDLQASRIGQEIPADWLKFPDLVELAAAVKVKKFEPGSVIGATVTALHNTRAVTIKLAMRGNQDFRKQVNTWLLNPDWDDLQKRDQAFGAKYRAALEAQGFGCKAVNPPPTTRPSSTR